MTFAVEVVVQLKPVVNDPQGIVVRDSLRRLGFEEVRGARVGKLITLEIDAQDASAVREQVSRMCAQLLCNPVIEDYRIGSVGELAAVP